MTNQVNNQSLIPSTDVRQFTLTWRWPQHWLSKCQSLSTGNNTPIQDYLHPDNHVSPTKWLQGTNLSQFYYYNIIIISKYTPVLEMLLPFTFIARVGFNIINWRLFTFVTATWPSDLLLNCQDAPSCWLRQSTTSIPTLCLVLGRV